MIWLVATRHFLEIFLHSASHFRTVPFWYVFAKNVDYGLYRKQCAAAEKLRLITLFSKHLVQCVILKMKLYQYVFSLMLYILANFPYFLFWLPTTLHQYIMYVLQLCIPNLLKTKNNILLQPSSCRIILQLKSYLSKSFIP